MVQGEKSERPPMAFAIPDLNPIENLWDDLEKRVKDIQARNANEKFAILSPGMVQDRPVHDRSSDGLNAQQMRRGHQV